MFTTTEAQLGAQLVRGSSSACLADAAHPGHIMKSLVHCSMVSVGLVTVWPMVFGDEKISKSLPPCTRARLSSCHAAGGACETARWLHVLHCAHARAGLASLRVAVLQADNMQALNARHTVRHA